MRLYTAGECVTPGEPPLLKLSLLEIGAAQISNEPQPTGLATCCPDMVNAPGVSPLPLLHHIFLLLLFCFSVWKFACGQYLLLSVVLCQSPSAFVLLLQIRLGSCEVPLTGHCPRRVPPALCLSHYRTCEPLQLLLARQLGLLRSFFAFICTNPSFS